MRRILELTTIVLLVLTLPLAVWAQEDDDSALAKKTQNPISDLISLPFQNNYNMDYAGTDRAQNVLNIQPVIPINLNDDWNLITRTILPVVSQPNLTRSGRHTGIGDLQISGFLSPANKKGLILGGGPVMTFPTASSDSLGTGKTLLGPTAVGILMDGPWVTGLLLQNQWSVGGDGGRDNVNIFLGQPIINYNLSDGWYLTSVPIITANWNADTGSDVWTVPVGGGFGKIMRLGKLPINVQTQFFWNVHHPDIGPRWTWRFQVQLLFPKPK